jgi:hypothetical protein
MVWQSNGWRRNAVRLAVAIVSVVIFGSLASALAFGAALIVLKMSSFHAGFRFSEDWVREILTLNSVEMRHLCRVQAQALIY